MHMSKLLKFILFVLFVAFVSCNAVQQITQDYLQQIKSSKRIWIVYGTTDSTGAELQVLADVSEILTGFFKVGVLSNDQKVLKLYSDDGNVVQYTGSFEVNPIVDFILSNTNVVIQARSKAAKDVKANKEFLEKQAARANKQWNDQKQLRKKSDALVLDNNNWDSAFLKAREAFIINFYEANCSACIELNKEWESVATSLKGKVKVAKINMTEAEALQSQIQISQFPIIRFYPAGLKKLDTYSQYQGTKKKFSILQWANSMLSVKESSAIQIPVLNKQNYKTLCKDTKSTCIIAFVEDTSSVESQINALASKYLKKPISFLVAKKGDQPQFQKQVNVQQFPETVMMYCKGNKMLKMGGMDFTVIDQVINEITMGNRNNFIRYKFEEQLK